jgi:hypothetical protein
MRSREMPAIDDSMLIMATASSRTLDYVRLNLQTPRPPPAAGVRSSMASVSRTQVARPAGLTAPRMAPARLMLTRTNAGRDDVSAALSSPYAC